MVDCLEQRPSWTADGTQVPVDTSEANPNGLEFDNLFLDMNGIIHQCTHGDEVVTLPQVPETMRRVGAS